MLPFPLTTQVNILNAMSTGLIDKTTGEYTTADKKKLNIMDALKIGAVSLVAAPAAVVLGGGLVP